MASVGHPEGGGRSRLGPPLNPPLIILDIVAVL